MVILGMRSSPTGGPVAGLAQGQETLIAQPWRDIGRNVGNVDGFSGRLGQFGQRNAADGLRGRRRR